MSVSDTDRPPRPRLPDRKSHAPVHRARSTDRADPGLLPPRTPGGGVAFADSSTYAIKVVDGGGAPARILKRERSADRQSGRGPGDDAGPDRADTWGLSSPYRRPCPTPSAPTAWHRAGCAGRARGGPTAPAGAELREGAAARARSRREARSSLTDQLPRPPGSGGPAVLAGDRGVPGVGRRRGPMEIFGPGGDGCRASAADLRPERDDLGAPAVVDAGRLVLRPDVRPAPQPSLAVEGPR